MSQLSIEKKNPLKLKISQLFKRKKLLGAKFFIHCETHCQKFQNLKIKKISTFLNSGGPELYFRRKKIGSDIFHQINVLWRLQVVWVPIFFNMRIFTFTFTFFLRFYVGLVIYILECNDLQNFNLLILKIRFLK